MVVFLLLFYIVGALALEYVGDVMCYGCFVCPSCEDDHLTASVSNSWKYWRRHVYTELDALTYG